MVTLTEITGGSCPRPPIASQDLILHWQRGHYFCRRRFHARTGESCRVASSDPAFNDPNVGASLNAQAAVDGTESSVLITLVCSPPTFHLDPTAIVADTQVRDGGTGHLTDVYIGSGVLALTATQTDPNPNTVPFGYLSRDGSYHLVRLSIDGSMDLLFQGQTFPVSMSFIRLLRLPTELMETSS